MGMQYIHYNTLKKTKKTLFTITYKIITPEYIHLYCNTKISGVQ